MRPHAPSTVLSQRPKVSVLRQPPQARGRSPARTPSSRSRRSLFDQQLSQLLAQRDHAGADPGFYRAERDLEAIRELGLRQAEKVGLLDEQPLIARQCRQRAIDGGLLLA